MDLSALDFEEVRARVVSAPAVVPVGGRTQWEVGGPPPSGIEVRAPGGVVAFDPADLTVTVGGGTAVVELEAALGAAGQECPLDPRAPDATVGGVLAAGLSGHRRLRHGPLRDRVLEVRFVTADGRVVKAGGPTVKNVSGYDLPRLLVGSLGTIGVIVQVTLRAQPRAERAAWAVGEGDPREIHRRLFRPACVAWDGAGTRVLIEGHHADVEGELRAAALVAVDAGPAWPEGAHRGRISVRPRAVVAVGEALRSTDCRWLAEVGVGTVHVAADGVDALAAAGEIARAHGGWLLREAGGTGLDPFGGPLPNLALVRRIKAAFDPEGRMAPGRLPLGTGSASPSICC